MRGSQGMKDVLERKRSYEDHKEFLDSFQCYREVRKGWMNGGVLARCLSVCRG